jgi:EAL domain-containing protein (putative c-di-GMP-specific phosphodiesterase class I)/AmiR/NasT family two-component response regulator
MPTSTPTDDTHSPVGATSATPARDLCFLIAEDHEFQRSMMVGMLEGLGAKAVYEACDGRSAMEITRELDYPLDIIVTDIDMPGMDGMAFIRRLGEAKVGASLIITSSLDRSLLDTIATMTAAYGMRLLGTVEKPATPERFAEMIALHRQAKPKPERLKLSVSVFDLEQVLTGLRAEEFEPFYQPKIDLQTSRVKGAEALARWRHPNSGIVAPHAFLGLLEESGHIGELTWVMLAQSARDCRSWRDAGLDLNVSVNLSVKQLADPAIADAITWQVTSQGLEPRHMILEITESAAMTDVGRVLENLTRLRMKGFGLSIDDYGTGYSSMQQLTRIPFTELKIDQSFVMHAAHQESNRMILESSLEMARKLGITSVAEGAETQDDWNLLRECGCDLAQGFFIARPMEAAVFPDWVRDWA